MVKDFLFLQELVDCLCGLEVHLVPNTQEGILELITHIFPDLLPSPQSEQAVLRSLQTIRPGCIYDAESVLGLRHAVYYYQPTGQLLILGPCREDGHSESEIAHLLRRSKLDEGRVRRLQSFYFQQPVVTFDKLHRLSELLAQQLSDSQAPIPHERLNLHWGLEEHREMLEVAPYEELDQIRRVENRYAASAALTEAVKQGNLALAYRFVQKMGSIPDDLVRSSDSLRNSQNLCIILNTQLRHALEEAGVHPYRLDQISGAIARKIEKLNSQTAVNSYFREILQQYCQLAQEQDQKELSSFARLAVTYIRSHLSDNLTVKDAAKALLMNPDYLSAQFHKEVGLPFITYLNQQRVRQAAALLSRTDLQIQQIASMVGYNNTSYFTRQFVRFQGITPRAFRKERMAGI